MGLGDWIKKGASIVGAVNPVGTIVGGAATAQGKGNPLQGIQEFMFGKEGTDAGNLIEGSPGYAAMMADAQAANDPALRAAVMRAIDPRSGSQMATEQFMNNPLFKQMYEKGGMQDQMFGEQADLAKRGWSLQPEDHEAYGQASDNIARLFGQEEQSIAQALASRGLAAAPSGAAGVAYSGAMGNKFERLASSQRDIAQKRMEMNRQRLNDVRSQLMNSQRLAQVGVQDQFDRNMSGVDRRSDMLKGSVEAAKAAQEQKNAQHQQRMDSEEGGLWDAIKGGVFSGVTRGTSKAVGGAIGGLGSGGGLGGGGLG